MKVWLLFALVVFPHLAAADGPALAHLTLGGETITLTADDDVNATSVIQPDMDEMHLHFAQRHLGFPLPPHLAVSLHNRNGAWSVTDLSLEQNGPLAPLVFGVDALRVIAAADAPVTFTIEGEAMTPDAAPVPVRIEISLRSP